MGSNKVLITSIAPKKSYDKEITRVCNNPVVLPERTLTQEEVEAYWGTDRISLVQCRNKHKALVELKDR